MPSVGGMPTLSQVRSWGTAHLTEAAAQWTTTATLWEDAFTDVATQITHPGGAPWEGVAAEAAQHRAYTDRLKVVGLADQLHDAARIARTGATQIDEARRLVLRTVQSAEAAGFTVGEDFSVTDPRLYDAGTAAIRQAQAEAFATDLRAGAGALVATDSSVTGRLTAATAGLGAATFPESGEAPTGVQLVDYKKAPPTPVPGTPDDPVNDVERHSVYPDHRPDGTWAPGNTGVDGKAAADYTFEQMEAKGIPLVRQEIPVKVVDPATGTTYTRKYDALQPTGIPGKFIGLEHKVNTSPITSNQEAVDALVKSGVPARGMLNGQPIEVVKVDVIRMPWPPQPVRLPEIAPAEVAPPLSRPAIEPLPVSPVRPAAPIIGPPVIGGGHLLESLDGHPLP